MHCPSCGHQIDRAATKGKPRSIQQHRRFFAMISAAYHHWPANHSTQFATVEDCRKWLTMRSGWRDVAARIPLVGVRPAIAVMLIDCAFRAAGAHAHAVEHKGELVIWVPRSIAFDKMPHAEFCQLNDAVALAIEAESGLKVDDLLSAGTDAACQETILV